jgi:hypothetical protein
MKKLLDNVIISVLYTLSGLFIVAGILGWVGVLRLSDLGPFRTLMFGLVFLLLGRFWREY